MRIIKAITFFALSFAVSGGAVFFYYIVSQ